MLNDPIVKMMMKNPTWDIQIKRVREVLQFHLFTEIQLGHETKKVYLTRVLNCFHIYESTDVNSLIDRFVTDLEFEMDLAIKMFHERKHLQKPIEDDDD